MEKQDYINRINQAVREGDPYAVFLANVMQSFNQTQTDYFLDVVAKYYMDGPGKTPYGESFKDMEYMARAVAQNKDVSSILGTDYRQISSYVNYLPEIKKVEPAIQENHRRPEIPRSINQKIQDMYQMINTYVMHPANGKDGISNSTFCQSGSVEKTKIPIQGWKFHISANSLDDYERLLNAVLPEFQKHNIAFKVVRPDVFDQLMQSTQAGKAITVYPTPDFDINRFSPELRSVLFEEGICPQGDAQIAGRICARYGQFRRAPGLITHSGTFQQDLRGVAVKPDFVQENSPQEILNFYADSGRRYQETGDAKTYIQELATLTAGNGRDNPWITVVVEKSMQGLVNSMIEKSGRNPGSFAFRVGDETYTLIKADESARILNALTNAGIRYERPEWDERYNVYAFENPDVASQVADVMQQNCNAAGMPSVECVDIPGYGTGIMVDTTLNAKFMDICRDNQLAIADIGLNLPKQEIGEMGITFSGDDKEVKIGEEFSFG